MRLDACRVPRLADGAVLIEDRLGGIPVYVVSVPETGLVYELPEAGYESLRAMNDIRTEAEIAEQIVVRFDVSSEQASRDLGALVDELQGLGLVTTRDGS